MERRFGTNWGSFALLVLALVASSVTCFDTLGDEVIRLAGIGEDVADWPPQFHEPVATAADVNPFLWMLHHLEEPAADRVDTHHYSRLLPPESSVGAFGGADQRETATIGGQDRESLESDAETFIDELGPNPDERQRPPSSSVHRPGLTPPYRPPSASHHPDVETLDDNRRPAAASPFDTSSLFPHHFNSFFNTPLETGFFGAAGLPGFGFFDSHANRPWWKGDNVCTEREEKEEDIASSDNEEVAVNGGTSDGGSSSFGFHGFSTFNLNVQTCAEKQHKYVCTSIKNVNGRKRTEKITRQCCHGFGRPRNGPPNAHCQKLDLYSMEETVERLGAKEFISTLKKSGLEATLESNDVTLFVVPDSAYTSFAEQMWENNLVAFDPMARAKRAIDFASMTARDMILAHTVNGSYFIEDVSNEQLLKTDLPGANIRINIYPRGPMSSARDQSYAEHPYRYTANCAPLLKLNRVADRGVVHVVDRVLVPARNTLMDIIEARDDMTLMRTFLEMTGLDKTLREQGDDKHYTIFAPNDDAFLKLDKDIRRKLKAGNGCAMNILKNHILDITFCSLAAVNGVKTSTYNLLNEKLEFEYAMVGKTRAPTAANADEAGETIDEGDGKKTQRIRINGQATIEESDVIASNGVLHVIDSVLPTDSGMPISNTLANHNLTVFKQLLTDAGLEEEFDAMSNRTFFIPTDQAFEQTETGRYWIRQLKEHPESLRGNSALKEFLEYHVAEPLIKTCALEETSVPTKAGQNVRVNLYTTNPIFTTVMNRATVNCARLVRFDEETCGSVVHEIDKVLDVPKTNLMDALSANPEYSMFQRLVSLTNLTELLTSPDAGLTLLVPKNDVFLEVDAWYQETLQNQDELERIIRAHILPNVICCTGIVPSEWPFVRTTETVSGQQLKLNRNRRPQVQNAGITKCDVVARNGIIHEINDVINVQPQRTSTTGASSGNPFESFGSLARPLPFWFK
ncbi:transforming growth factor-beta-induced protein ig-h3 isoform X2 [Anopheles stephensi]|uniref:transforming growth factor-beta-induced protein ig-h3 isoform X2 n=1 Tax=Anopheles stephensi TaxID=30069 RepID=UPI001658A2C0|nr:transforming growth factor-beta-induced protein ig-h3 isoform X2 [Anopheles stephensi]